MITLVYPDRTEVKNLPGSTESFILKKYKEELGKPYSRIYFYLTKTSDFLKFMLDEAYSPLEDEEDDDVINLSFRFSVLTGHFDAISFQEPNNEFVLIATMEVLGNQVVGFRLPLALVTSVIF